MDEQAVEELNALRARAYGRGGDLHSDPRGLHRLRELEERALELRASSVPDPRIPEAPSSIGAVPPPAGERAPIGVMPVFGPPAEGPRVPEPETDAAEPDEAPAAPRLRWTRGRIATLWVASLAAAVLASAAVSAALTWRVQADPREIAVLSIDRAVEWPSEMFGDETSGSRMFAEFYGLRPLVPGAWGGTAAPVQCLNVMVDADLEDGSQGYSAFGGCAAGAFPATAGIVVTAGTSPMTGAPLPPELLERFPEGTSLQFVLEDTRVIVLSLPPAQDAGEGTEARSSGVALEQTRLSLPQPR